MEQNKDDNWKAQTVHARPVYYSKGEHREPNICLGLLALFFTCV
jgi:hypothetical protein